MHCGVGCPYFGFELVCCHNPLKAEGWVFHKRVGKQNEWWPGDVGGQRERIRELERIIEEQDRMIPGLESKIRNWGLSSSIFLLCDSFNSCGV